MELFPGFGRWGNVVKQVEIKTSRLDDVPQAMDASFAKLDVQGAELMILQHGTSVLSRLALLELECSPSPLYEGQPDIYEVGSWLGEHGFRLHMFSHQDRRSLKPYGTEENPYTGKNHLFQVDAVFIPDFLRWNDLDDRRLTHLAFLAHALYRSHDIAMRAMDHLDKRDSGNRVLRYQKYLQEAGFDA
jgi:hypothetical protein